MIHDELKQSWLMLRCVCVMDMCIRSGAGRAGDGTSLREWQWQTRRQWQTAAALGHLNLELGRGVVSGRRCGRNFLCVDRQFAATVGDHWQSPEERKGCNYFGDLDVLTCDVTLTRNLLLSSPSCLKMMSICTFPSKNTWFSLDNIKKYEFTFMSQNTLKSQEN